MSVYERSKHEGEVAALAAARRAGIDLVSVNPSSVQGPGRAGGTGRILIAYLNGRLKAFVDTNLSLVDIRDCVEGHLLAAERGVPGERYVLSGATLTSLEALEIVSGLTGDRRPAAHPAAGRRPRPPAALIEGGFRVRPPQAPGLPRDGAHDAARPSLRRLARDARARPRLHAGARHAGAHGRLGARAGSADAPASGVGRSGCVGRPGSGYP